MQAEEIDVALDELETRLDRLRSLYEQYFLGIEKIEPTVARKDVDRRFWILRRTQIRNTARRFRLQVLVQRYNTFQQYWVRICREIENGTYSRHLLRAQKKLGEEPKTWAAKKRLGYFRRHGKGDNGSRSEPPHSGEDLARMLDSGTDLDAEAASAAAEALVSAETRSGEQARETAPTSAATAETTSAVQGAANPAAPPRRGVLETLDLDLDDALGPSPAPARPVVPKAAVQAPRPPAPAGPPTPSPVAPPARTAEARPPAVPVPAPKAARVPVPKPAQPAVSQQPAASPHRAAPAAGAITDERLKQIHAEFSAAKRQAKQAESVSLEALRKSLRESEQRLRAQHPGRSIDFHVVVKDGKPVVKPIVRK